MGIFVNGMPIEEYRKQEKQKQISRRNFLKVLGGVGIGVAASAVGVGAYSCSTAEPKSEGTAVASDSDNIDNRVIAKQGAVWVPTGNKKEFAEGQHFVGVTVMYEYETTLHTSSTYNHELPTYDGYMVVGSHEIESGYQGSRTIGVMYDLINTVPVEVDEYRHKETGEVEYSKPGKPFDLEAAKDKPKVYIK